MVKKRVVSAEVLAKMRGKRFLLWLKNAKIKHGNRFDYGLCSKMFETQKSPAVIIGCPDHGSFAVLPAKHLAYQNGGCIECGEEARSTSRKGHYQRSYEKWFDENLPENLEFCSDYLGGMKPIKVRCKIHDTIKETTPANLKNNKTLGCDLCAREVISSGLRLDLAEVQSELSEVLPDHIRIVDLDFTRGNTKLVAECETHGRFLTTLYNARLGRYVCRKCWQLTAGYTSSRLEYLVKEREKGEMAVLGVMSVEVFGCSSIKVGVTTRELKDRYQWYLKTIHFSVRLHEIDAYILENKIHTEFQKNSDTRILKAGMRGGERWAGDTELYFPSKLEEITLYAREKTKEILAGNVDYENEFLDFRATGSSGIDLAREKDDTNKPVPIVGVEPETNQIKYEFSSIAEAKRAGFTGLSRALSPTNTINLSGSLRWFRKDQFDPKNIPNIGYSKNGRVVLCVERNQLFPSAKAAERQLRADGIDVTGSHIGSSCRGLRPGAGGYTWEYSEIELGDIDQHNTENMRHASAAPLKNRRRSVRVYEAASGRLVGKYASMTKAAAAIGASQPSVISTALSKQNGYVLGYKIERGDG